MKRRFLLIATVAAVTVAGVATAQRGPGPGPMMGPMGGFGLLQHDANADGKLTRAEFDASLRARFNELDTNRDGAVTAEEMQAVRKARMEAAQAERFARLDTDKNGQLSQSELQAAGPGAMTGGRGWGRGPGRGGPGGRGGDGDARRGDRTGLGPMDADNDGRLTFAEFSARPLEAFNRADTNKDGVVTIAELQAQRPGQR